MHTAEVAEVAEVAAAARSGKVGGPTVPKCELCRKVHKPCEYNHPDEICKRCRQRGCNDFKDCGYKRYSHGKRDERHENQDLENSVMAESRPSLIPDQLLQQICDLIQEDEEEVMRLIVKQYVRKRPDAYLKARTYIDSAFRGDTTESELNPIQKSNHETEEWPWEAEDIGTPVQIWGGTLGQLERVNFLDVRNILPVVTEPGPTLPRPEGHEQTYPPEIVMEDYLPSAAQGFAKRPTSTRNSQALEPGFGTTSVGTSSLSLLSPRPQSISESAKSPSPLRYSFPPPEHTGPAQDPPSNLRGGETPTIFETLSYPTTWHDGRYVQPGGHDMENFGQSAWRR